MERVQKVNAMDLTFSVVKKYIDKNDFFKLLALGAPRDEYDIESRKISGLITCDSTTDEIARAIYKVMHRAFADISDNVAMKYDLFLGFVDKI